MEFEFSLEQHKAIFAQLPNDLKSLVAGSYVAAKSPLQIVGEQQQYLTENPVVMDTILCYGNKENLTSPASIRIAQIRHSVLSQYLDEKYPKVCPETKNLFLSKAPIDAPLPRQIKAFEMFCNLRQVDRAVFEGPFVELIIKICLQTYGCK